MAIERSIDHDRRLISYTASGILETNELVEAIRETLGRREPGLIYDLISDSRQVVKPPRPDQIEPVVTELRRVGFLRGLRAAMIVADNASHGMLRMLGAYTDPLGIEMGIFRDPAEAYAFIDRRASA